MVETWNNKLAVNSKEMKKYYHNMNGQYDR